MLHFLEQEFGKAPMQGAKDIVLQTVSRRGFLGTAAAGFTLAAFAGSAEAFSPYKTGGDAMANGLRTDPLLFVAIDKDGTVTLTAHRSEMGTGARTSLPMVLADEMEADWNRVKIWQAPGDEPKYGNQDTDGSRSLRHHIQTMRQMGASVRHMMANAAAKKWGVDVSDVTVENHQAKSSSGETLGFGELAEAAMAEKVPAFEALTFKTADQFRYIGKGEVQITDLHDITTGKAVYGADVMLDNMLIAVVARPPVVGGKVKSVNTDKAMAVKGVQSTQELAGSIMPAKFAPLGGIAVLADNTYAALAGRDALEIEWEDGPHAVYNSDSYRAEMEETAKKPGKVLRNQGDAGAAFKDAAKTFGQSYYQAHMIHAPMEPPVAVANVTADGAEIWAPVQSPFGARGDVAAALEMDIEKVKVNVTLLGGGFGRKSKCDFAIEAALLSRAAKRPVKVQWTREDDIRHGFYHTASVERIEVAMDADDKVTGWRHNSVAPSILSTFAPDSGHQFFIESGMGHIDMPFEIENISVENGKAMAHTRIGWFRSVSNIPRAFAVQSFAAELAEELGRDQKEMLLELIGSPRIIDPKTANFPEDFWDYGEVYDEFPIDTGRLSKTLNLAADAAGWGKDLPEGEGIGLAVHRSFVSYIAAAAHVKMVDGKITIPEMHIAIDCGFPANPERIRSQVEGSAVMGMTLALYSGITYENGRVTQSNFNDYEMVRTSNFPRKVNTIIVDNPFSVHASGVGEPAVPPVAPAIANAIFNATGKRMRSLPIGETI